MKIDLKNIGIDVTLGAMNIIASTAKEDDTQKIKLDVSSDKVSGSANMDIKLSPKSE